MIEKFAGISQDPDGLSERNVDEYDLTVYTSYCTLCPCGVSGRVNRDYEGVLGFTNCPCSGKHQFMYLNPLTGERYQKNVLYPNTKQETTCEMKVVCTYEETRLELKDMLVIPEGWTLEVEDDSDYGDCLDLSMDLNLIRTPDPTAYQQWMQDSQNAKKKAERDKEIVRLQQRLNELTGNA